MMHVSESLPPLDGLNVLLAAADAGSFTAAAEILGITHGSVSRRIAALERWLGTELFERHGRGVRLTPAGQRFAADARMALSSLTRSADQWRPPRGRQTVRLIVIGGITDPQAARRAQVEYSAAQHASPASENISLGVPRWSVTI